MERDMARIVCWVRSSNRGLLIRSLDFNLRAATFSKRALWSVHLYFRESSPVSV